MTKIFPGKLLNIITKKIAAKIDIYLIWFLTSLTIEELINLELILKSEKDHAKSLAKIEVELNTKLDEWVSTKNKSNSYNL